MTTDNSAANRCGAMECIGHPDATPDKVFDFARARQVCLCCGSTAEFARVVHSNSLGVVAGVCGACVQAGSEQRSQDTTRLAAAADRLASYLALVRRGAARELAAWYGGIGACTQAELNAATVDLRRALERMGWKR